MKQEEEVTVSEPTDKADEEFPLITVHYGADLNYVVLSANEVGLKYLLELIQSLIDSGIPGSHYHIDRIAGLEGNVNEIVIERTE